MRDPSRRSLWRPEGWRRPFDAWFDEVVTLLPERFMMPRGEVLERNNELIVRADLPGFQREDINLTVTDDALVISARRESEREEEGTGYYRSERQFGTFHRNISFPVAVDSSRATARLKDGVLEVRIPLREQVEPTGHRIEIE